MKRILDQQPQTLVVLFLLFFTFLLYFNSLNAPFYFDDKHMIEDNLFIKNPQYFGWIFKGYVTSGVIPKGMMRPVLMLTFAMNYFGGGLNTLSYHIINVLLHFLCAVFLFIFLRYLFKGASLWFLSCVCLLFVSHPLNTEAVVYLSSRSDLLVTLFTGISFMLYLNGRFGLMAIVYALALLSKETALCLPILIFAYELIFTSRKSPVLPASRTSGYNKPRLYAALAIALVMFFYFIYKESFFKSPFSAPPLRTYYSNILTQAAVTFFYIKLFFWPSGLNLIHHFPDLVSLRQPEAFLPLAGIFALIALIVIFKKRNPLLSFGLTWYLICLMPKFYARLNYVACEHHFYMPSIGLYVAIAAVCLPFYAKYKKYFFYSAGGLCAILAVLTLLRNYEYSDAYRFWSAAVLREPLSISSHNELGLEYIRRGDAFGAEKEFKKTIALSGMARINLPNVVNSKGNLAGIYRLRGQRDKAISLLNELAMINPPPPKTYENIGIIYMEMGREKEALLAWEKELKNYPQAAGTYAMLGLHQLNKGDVNKASELFGEVLRLEPDSYLGLYGTGRVREAEGNPDKAVFYYLKAINCAPYYFDAHYALGRIYLKQGNPLALSEFYTALRLNPRAEGAYNGLAIACASLNPPDWVKARFYANKAKAMGYPVSEGFMKTIESNIPVNVSNASSE